MDDTNRLPLHTEPPVEICCRVRPPPSGKDGLLPPLLGEDGAGLVLGVRVVGQLRRACGRGALQHGLLQVVEHRRVLLGQEGQGHTALAGTTRSANTMDVICERGRSKRTCVCVRGDPHMPFGFKLATSVTFN